jgi:hypothetical protein
MWAATSSAAWIARLERVLDEALLHVEVQSIEAVQRPQLVDVGLDSRELLRDEVGVGHAERAAPGRR